MAFNISYTIKAIDKFSAPLDKINAKIDGVDKKTKGLGAGLGSAIGGVAKGFLGVAASLVSVDAAMAAIKKFSEFEDSIAELSAITGATGADLDRLKKSAFALGKQFGKTGVDVSEAFKLVASAKPELLENIPALEKVTNEVLKLSVASGVDMATAANFTAQSLNIFGEGADQAARFVNVLAAESKLGASEVNDTGEALLKAGPAAKVAGLSLEQTVGAIEMLALGGLKGSEAGNALNSMLMRLQTKGFNFKDGAGKVFEKIKKQLDAIKDPTERAALSAELFGMEHAKAGEMLAAASGKIDAYTRSITGTNTANEQASVMMSTLSARFAQVGVALEEKLMTVMYGLAPLFDMMAGKAEYLMSRFTPEALLVITTIFQGLGFAIGIVGTAISGLIDLVVTVLDLFARLSKTIGLVMAEIASGGELELMQEMKGIWEAILPAMGTETKIDVNIKDNGGNVGAVQSKGDGNVNVGRNMAGAGA